jgi:hypothetical protein
VQLTPQSKIHLSATMLATNQGVGFNSQWWLCYRAASESTYTPVNQNEIQGLTSPYTYHRVAIVDVMRVASAGSYVFGLCVWNDGSANQLALAKVTVLVSN